jgi:two-component system chemotaxis response regulator CheY
VTGNGRERREKNGPRVLVVEDDPTVRRLIVDILTGNNHAECAEASTVPEAIEHLNDGPFEAVVSDVLLRGGGGKMLFAYLEKEDQSLSRRIVFVTGLLESPDVESICRTTGNILLRKPFFIRELADAVDTILARG